ncbi:MAG: hypothetical protein ACREXW_01140 [Gammaproteobacteria bacterium]
MNDLYDALRKAGVDDDTARKAAQAVLGSQEKEQLVTKDLLHAEMNGLKAEIQAMINRLLLSLIGIIVGSMVAMTGVFAAIVKWL